MCESAHDQRSPCASLANARELRNDNTTIMAAGNRVIMTATWELTEAQYREQLTIHHITPEQFEAHMQRLTQRLACGQEPAAAFVTLGGQIQYSYISGDGHPIVAPVIDNCR